MALSFPRTLPEAFVGEIEFEIERLDQASPDVAGRMNAVTLGTPRWLARYVIGNVSPDKAQEVQAWVSSLRGMQRLFLGYDPRRRYPKLHPAGLANGSGWSVNGTRDVLTVSGGGTASLGDYVSLVWSGSGMSLHRYVEAGAHGAGLQVEPAVPAFVPGGAIPVFNSPSACMRLTPETQIGPARSRSWLSGVIVAAQHFVL